MSVAVSVITPVYNVRRFVRKCAESLLSQTFKDAEFIFVDDSSSDGSIDVLESVIDCYPERNVRVIRHTENRGLPACRKTGYEAAVGRYIFNCDGDDFVEQTLLEEMYAAVSEKDVDYAYCDFYLTYESSERYMKCPNFITADDALRIGYLSGAAKYNVWNKLIKRDLYNGVIFPVEHRKGGEDMIMLGILSKARSVAYVPEALYHYVKTNASAISENFSEQRLIDVKYNADNAIDILRKTYPFDLEREINFFKLNVKLQFVITDDDAKYNVWKEWYPEANEFIWSNKYQSTRNKIVQWMAMKGHFWAVRLYYKLAYRFVYKSIYG